MGRAGSQFDSPWADFLRPGPAHSELWFLSMIKSFVLVVAGATLSNRYRMDEFRNVNQDSHKFYQDLIAKQDAYIDEFKQHLSISPSVDLCEQIRLLNEESEQ